MESQRQPPKKETTKQKLYLKNQFPEEESSKKIRLAEIPQANLSPEYLNFEDYLNRELLVYFEAFQLPNPENNLRLAVQDKFIFRR